LIDQLNSFDANPPTSMACTAQTGLDQGQNRRGQGNHSTTTLLVIGANQAKSV
jgi:hypothetical protein